MPLDTRIALGVQPLQVQFRDPMASYNQLAQLQSADTQNQLAQMQMSAAQRAMQEEEGAKNFLSGNPDLSIPENQRRLLAFGKTGLAYGKAISEQQKSKGEADKTAAEVLGLNQKNFTAINPPIRAAAGGIPGITAYVEAMYKDPVLGALAARVKTKEQALKENIEMYTKDPDQWVTAHSNLEGAQMLDALKMNAERVAEKARISSLPPLSGAVPTGTVDDTRAALAAPGAQTVAEGVQARPVAAAGELVPVALNAMAPVAAVGVNALAAPTGNEATLQAMAAARKPIEDRLGILNRLPYSKGVEIEVKRLEAQLKELNAQVNLRPDGSAITPYGVLTAAAAPSDILRLQREEADLRAAGKTKEADVIAGQIKVKNQLRDDRSEMEKLVDAEIAARNAGQLRKAADLAEQIAAKNQSIDITTMKALNYPITKEGFKAYQDAKRQEKAASEFEQLLEASGMTDEQKKAARLERIKKESTFAPPMQITMPVAVEDPSRPGSVIYVDRAEAIGKTPATAIEGLAPKEIQAREAKYPQALQAVKTLDTKTESLAKDIEVLANHPGLTGISGLIYGRTPAVTKDARAAQALYDSIVARGGFAELQNMRAASPTGGALGNVSNQEGQYLRDAWAAINRTQDTEDLKANLLKAAAQARASKASIKEAFDATYEYRANRGAAAPAAAVPSGRGVDTNNPLLKGQ